MASNFPDKVLLVSTSRLLDTLNTSKTQKDNNALYQTIKNLIGIVSEAVDAINKLAATVNNTTVTPSSTSFGGGIPGLQGDDGEDGLMGPPGISTPGTPGPTGATGPAGPAIIFPLSDDPEDVYPIPGRPGDTGAQGIQGIQGLIGPPGMDGNDGDDGMAIPGPIGLTGSQGIQGIAGAIGMIGEDGEEGPIGPPGRQGIDGAQGTSGPIGPPGFDGEDGEQGFFITGAVGAIGPQGPIGPAGGMRMERFTAEVSSKSAKSGRFDYEVFTPFSIAQVGQPILVVQDSGRVIGRGQYGDEAEWDRIDCVGEVVNRKKLRVRWTSKSVVRGKYNFLFLTQLNPLSTLNFTFGTTYRSFGFTIGNGQDVITTGLKGYTPPMPANGTLLQAYVESVDSSASPIVGSISIDVWKASVDNFPPKLANTVVGGNYITLTSQISNKMLSLPGWNTAFQFGDIYGFNVNSISLLTKAQVTLIVSIP